MCRRRTPPLFGRVRRDIELFVFASVSLAFALGPLKGGVYFHLGILAKFHGGSGTDTRLLIGARMIICGVVDVLGHRLGHARR